MKKRIISYLLLISFLVVPLAGFPEVVSADNALTLYTTFPGAVESTAYSVTVNGQKVFVEKYKDISYARFAFSGTVNVTVSVNENITSNNISPHSYKITPSVSGKSMNFSLQQSRKLIVNINNLEKLFIFADPMEENPPKLGGDGVYNVMDYAGVDNTGAKLSTKAIQNALDDVTSKPNGGVLYFPNGKYLTGTLHIKSNTTVYLQDGALIHGTGNVDDFPRPIVFQDGTEALIGALVTFDQATNSKLTGRGALDGDGRTLRLNGRDAWLTSVMESNHIVVEDVILRDSAAFNSHIAFSEYVTYQRVKLINDIDLPNTDGIDPDSSRHVVIDDVFSYCSDDSVSVKTHRYTTLVQDSYDIVVKNNVFWTRKSALKVGDETFAYNMYDIHFINNDVVHADRAIVVYVSDGSTVSNIHWINNRAEEIGGDTFERVVDMWLRTREESMSTPGKVENLVIKDFYLEKFSKNNSNIEGLDAEHLIKNIYIDNFVVDGKKMNSLEEAKIGTNRFVQDVVFGTAPTLPAYSAPEDESVVAGTFVEKNGLVVLEAENYIRNTEKSGNQWVMDTQKRGALGQGAMMSGTEGGQPYTDNVVNTSPRLDYNVNFSTMGTYYVWARMYAQNTSNDYIYAGLNGSTPTNANAIIGDPNKGGWYWNDKNKENGYATIDIKEPGVHTINVYMGTHTTHFDKMFLMRADSGDALPNYFSPGRKGMGPRESEIYPGIPVTIDGVLQKYEVPATEINGRVLVPMRAIFEKLGASVEWNDPAVTATKGSTKIVLTVGDSTAKKNGEEIELSQPPVIIDGRTMVPVRFVSEALGEKVEWLDARGVVQIGDPSLAPKNEGGNIISTVTPNSGNSAASAPSQSAPSGEKVEAQKMTLNGYAIENNQFASVSMCIRTDGIGTAIHKFTGEQGTYAINVVYFDENDGTASYKLFVAGKEVEKWMADDDLGNASPISETKTIRTINDISLKAGDEIKIEGTADGGEAARIDYIEIIKGYVEPANKTSSSSSSASNSVDGRYEAEKMTLNAYEIESSQFASKAMCVKTTGIGTASLKYEGDGGTFALNVAYFDENDGAASYKLFVGGKQVDTWAADEDLGNASPIAETLVVRTVRNVVFKSGDEIKIEGTADAGESARFDYIEIVGNDTVGSGGGSDGSTASNALDLRGKRYEAEKMTLKGYAAETNQYASKGMVIKAAGIGEASFKFPDDHGVYTLKVGYFDENDGNAGYKLYVAGKLIDEWLADQDLGSSSPNQQTFAVRTVKDVALSSGSLIKIVGTADGGAPARLDYIDIIY